MTPPTPPPDEHAKGIENLLSVCADDRFSNDLVGIAARVSAPAIRALQERVEELSAFCVSENKRAADAYILITKLRALAEKMAEGLAGYVEKSSRFEPDNVYQQKLAEALAEWRKWEERK